MKKVHTVSTCMVILLGDAFLYISVIISYQSGHGVGVSHMSIQECN